LRLEGILLDFKKLSTDSLNIHISKFSNIISAVIAQQPDNQQYDDTKVNRYFLRSLETANIPNEDWKGFITSLGKTWLTISTHKLYAEARTYYATHIMAQKSAAIDPSNTTFVESQDNLRALATTTNNFVPFPPVPRLHLPPSNAPIGPRQYRQNFSRPNYNGYNSFQNTQHQQQQQRQWTFITSTTSSPHHSQSYGHYYKSCLLINSMNSSSRNIGPRNKV
jgi:hypothetical protein